MTLRLVSLQRVLLRFSGFDGWCIMGGGLSLEKLMACVRYVCFFRIAGDKGLLRCPFRWAAPVTLRVSLIVYSFLICDFPSWEPICPLGLIPRFLLFFLVSFKVEFGLVDSFIVFIWWRYFVWDMLDSCDCNTWIRFRCIANNRELSAEFMILSFMSSFMSFSSHLLLCSLLYFYFLGYFLFFSSCSTRFGGGLSFRVFWEPCVAKKGLDLFL